MATKTTKETIFILNGETLAEAYKDRSLKASKWDKFIRTSLLDTIQPEPFPSPIALITLQFTRKFGPLGLHTVKVVDVQTEWEV